MLSDNDKTLHRKRSHNRFAISIIVYLALLADNILLTVIVPILPDFLAEISNKSALTIPQSIVYKNYDLHYIPNILTKHPTPGNSLVNLTSAIKTDNSLIQSRLKFLEKENFSIGLLLATKALVQLICNPVVGNVTAHFGYQLPIFFGTCCILISSLIFATGQTYTTILLARTLQGFGSSCISICGMSLVAQLYPEEDKRSKVMGIILGSVALGVLIGYPFGGITYDFLGKTAPFIMLSIFIGVAIGLQMVHLDLTKPENVVAGQPNLKWTNLLGNKSVLVLVIGIWLSTSAMAILEPCLPLWLLQNLNPKRWQLGTVFIPDSVGYFIGTNFFGTIAYKFGQIKISSISLVTVGISCLMIPSANSVYKLLLPHFCLGMSIGIIDAALVPLLASFVESKLNDEESIATNEETFSNYGSVYAIQQTSVSLAYCLGPIIGGELAETIGFAWLMRAVGVLNLIYGPLLLNYYNKYAKMFIGNDTHLTLTNNEGLTSYKRFYNSTDFQN